MDGLRREEEEATRSDDHLPMPHSLLNDAGLTSNHMDHLLAIVPFEIPPKEDIDGSLEQIEQLILLWMHLPLIAHASDFD
jgi:hypothetical protein